MMMLCYGVRGRWMEEQDSLLSVQPIFIRNGWLYCRPRTSWDKHGLRAISSIAVSAITAFGYRKEGKPMKQGLTVRGIHRRKFLAATDGRRAASVGRSKLERPSKGHERSDEEWKPSKNFCIERKRKNKRVWGKKELGCKGYRSEYNKGKAAEYSQTKDDYGIRTAVGKS